MDSFAEELPAREARPAGCAGTHAGQLGRGRRTYVRRQPEQSVLHRIVREHLETFLAEARQRGGGEGLPRFVERELREFLTCGVMARGFARFRCDGCTREILVAFSCKGRGFCPSCCGLRMGERAAHLVDGVLGGLPVRQWVLTLPFRLRYRLAYDHRLCRAVLGVFVRALLGFTQRRARALGLRGRAGAVTAIQRCGSALNVNPHFHTLLAEGVLAEQPDGSQRFVSLREPPSDVGVARLLARVRGRILRLLRRHDIDLEGGLDDGRSDPLALESPLLAQVQGASVLGRVATGPRAGQRVLRVGSDPTAPLVTTGGPRHAHIAGFDLAGFDLHANVAVRAGENERLEHLCRYIVRPPVAQDAVELTPANGSITPGAAPEAKPTPAAYVRSRYVAWADLLRRVFGFDVLACPDCGGRLRLLATIADRAVVEKILTHLGLPVDLPQPAAARTPAWLPGVRAAADHADPAGGHWTD